MADGEITIRFSVGTCTSHEHDAALTVPAMLDHAVREMRATLPA